ncbi:MAG: hypothetical protein LBP40_07350 [Campylobacteraceae bacterium]|jgi:predicted RNA-binding Zn-ribbon protein involved in translation (DUF1610 family)|nr:hypothetical protein [Campylobacteraceae bacterium]
MSYIKLFFIIIFGYYENYMLAFSVLIVLCIVVGAFFILRAKDEYKNFRSICLYNVIWKWKYKKNRIVSLWCYCPECGNALLCDDEYCRSAVNMTNKTTFLICKNCGDVEKGRIVGGDRNYLLRIVKFEIQKRIKNGTYKNEAKHEL